MKRAGQGVSGERELLTLRDMGLLAMLHRQVAMVGLEEAITGLGLREDQRLLRTIAKTTVTTKPIHERPKES